MKLARQGRGHPKAANSCVGSEGSIEETRWTHSFFVDPQTIRGKS